MGMCANETGDKEREAQEGKSIPIQMKVWHHKKFQVVNMVDTNRVYSIRYSRSFMTVTWYLSLIFAWYHKVEAL